MTLDKIIKNIKINFNNINIDTLLINLLITVFIVLISCLFLGRFPNNHQKIVIFDKELVFQDYLKSIKTVVNNSKDKNISQSFLDQKNKFFIENMISDLYAYQKNNDVIIIKRSSLSAPNAFLNSSFDITQKIETQLKKQGAL